MAIQIQFRNDTSTNWASFNPILAIGEMGIENDTDFFKIGDGATSWNSLPYGGISGAGVPIGGTAGQLISKVNGTDYNTQWVSQSSLAIAQSQVTDLSTALAGKSDTTHTHNSSAIATTVSDKASNYTIVAADKNSIIRSTSATTVTMTIANVLSVGESVTFIQYGAGQLIFSAGSGSTLTSYTNALKSAGQHASVSVTCVASGLYSLAGNLVI